MMSEQLFSSLNETVLTVFAEPFTVQTPTGSHLLEGIFEDSANNEQAVANVHFQDRSHSLSVRSDEVTEYQISERQTLTLRGQPYRIIALEDDLAGMTRLALRRYQ